MYEPTTGRWSTVDPSGFEAGDPNLFRDVGNDPTNATDPTGLKATYKDGSETKDITDELIVGLDFSKVKMATGMPDAEYLRKTGLSDIITEAGFDGLVRNIMNEIVKYDGTYSYASLAQAVNHAKYLAWVVVYAKKLQSLKPPFAVGGRLASFKGSKYWEPSDSIPFADPTGETKAKGLLLKKDAMPADGIREFFGENASNASIDCGTFQSLVSRRALLATLGEDKYNDMYKGIGVAGLNMVGDPFEFKRGPTTLIPGMAVQIGFPPNVSVPNGAYHDENCIFIGGPKRLCPANRATFQSAAYGACYESRDRKGRRCGRCRPKVFHRHRLQAIA